MSSGPIGVTRRRYGWGHPVPRPISGARATHTQPEDGDAVLARDLFALLLRPVYAGVYEVCRGLKLGSLMTIKEVHEWRERLKWKGKGRVRCVLIAR
jgi:hypothetical protein